MYKTPLYKLCVKHTLFTLKTFVQEQDIPLDVGKSGFFVVHLTNACHGWFMLLSEAYLEYSIIILKSFYCRKYLRAKASGIIL